MAQHVMAQVFAPPEQAWTGVSVRLATMRRSVLAATAGVAAAGLLAGGLVGGAILAPVIGLPVLLGLAGPAWAAIGRNHRSWGYAERAEDLLVTRGVLFRRLVVVPYGRMQLVDVVAGPIERYFGIATVRLHTAAAGTEAHIRGLLPDEAARLRDRLAALGEARSAGL